MAELLEALEAWPDVDLEALRERPEWSQAREWGWVMESGERTGTGPGSCWEVAERDR